MWVIEQGLFDYGIAMIAGVDEAGRGPLAGPVVAAAVIVPRGCLFNAKIDDSKKLSAAQRQKACAEIKERCVISFAVVGEQEIDAGNILKATLTAMAKALSRLSVVPQWAIIDGSICPNTPVPCGAVVGADGKSISVACASIVAKVTRDDIMLAYDKIYPEYGFAAHKGYGTKTHCEALQKYGPCAIHRKSFQPIKSLLQKQ